MTNDVVAQELAARYEIKDLGAPSMLLGIHVRHNQDERTVMLSQAHYIDAILERLGLSEAKPVATPLDPNVALKPAEQGEPTETARDESDERIRVGYATAIGSLMYAATATRPDIAYAVHTLAQFTSAPTGTHWTALKRVFRYLKGTRDYGLVYGANSKETDVSTFCDADWASNAHRHSISGYVSLVAGGAVAWSSKKQSTIALSTAEAEYIAATHAAKQVLWHGFLYDEIGHPRPDTLVLRSDNQAAIAISQNPEFHARTKHIDIALHFLRDHVEQKDIKLVYVPSNENLADIFTKALSKPAFEELRLGLGVIPARGGVL